MRLDNLFYNVHLTEFIESLMPDFILAFAFFTSLAYAVLGKRFEKQRPAIAMSTAIGLALATGLVCWEQANDLSIKDLGPIAVGFAIMILGFIMYHAVQKVGGSWAGAGITFGTCIIIAQLLKLDLFLDPQILQTITVVGLLVGVLTFLSHTKRNHSFLSGIIPSVSQSTLNMARLYRDRHISQNIEKNLRNLRKESSSLHEHPRDAENVILQIRRILPAEGYLTQRMAELREKAHRVKNGHIARLEETKNVFASLPIEVKKRASHQLITRYSQLIDFDTRLERLDKEVEEKELAIHLLTEKAQKAASAFNYKELDHMLKTAQKLQHQNSHIFKIIADTEKELAVIAQKTAAEVTKIANHR